MQEFPTPQTKNTPFLQSLRELAQTLVLALVLYAVLSTFVGRYEVLNISMEPTFHQGQRIVVNRAEHLLPSWMTHTVHANTGGAPTYSIFKYGQFAVFFPTDSRESDPLIKRVIALPGDHVVIKDTHVWVNDVQLAEPYTHSLPTTCNIFCDVHLGPSQYFMMGDNRTSSFDSREFGPINEANVMGNVVLRYWPLDKVEVYP